MRIASCLLTAMFTLSSPLARAEQNQFWLAAQHDWGDKRGWFLTVGSEYAAGETASLSNIRLTLGVADGSAWHFLAHNTKWEYGRLYSAKASITPGAAELSLNGVRVAARDVGLAPAPQSIAFNEQPAFLRGPADYIVRQANLRVTAGDQKLERSCATSALPVQLLLLNPAAGASRADLRVTSDVTIEAEFKLEPSPDLRSLSPFVDRFGQSIHADWPGKVRDESELRGAIADEQRRLSDWPAPNDRDPFGGLKAAGWTEHATGFFRTVKRNGTWWLISPEGNPCFYIGLDNAPALAWELSPVTGREFLFEWLPEHTGPFAAAWKQNAWHSSAESANQYFAAHTANLIRKFGDSWQSHASESAIRRAKALGFCGFGKWTPAEGVKGVPDFAVLYHGEIPNLVRHPDIFDPRIRQQWTELLRRQIEPRKNDPYLVGWSVGNEKDENIAADDIHRILAMDETPAKRALTQHAVAELFGGDESKWRTAWRSQEERDRGIELLRRFYADNYFRFIYETVKSIDPNHLYFGMWVTPNWWENEADWDLIAPHCDVLGYDFYALEFQSEPAARLISNHDKPVLCGEFAFPPDYGGERGYGRYHVSTRDDNEAGARYAKWLDAAASNPRCVGVCYFQYRDQPLLGRGPMPAGPALVVGENFAFGIVDVTDRLKWDFVRPVREANLAAARTRLDR